MVVLLFYDFAAHPGCHLDARWSCFTRREMKRDRSQGQELPTDRDVLCLEKFQQPFACTFTPDAALFHAAEWRGRIRGDAAVQTDHAELELLRKRQPTLQVPREDIGNQAV